MARVDLHPAGLPGTRKTRLRPTCGLSLDIWSAIVGMAPGNGDRAPAGARVAGRAAHARAGRRLRSGRHLRLAPALPVRPGRVHAGHQRHRLARAGGGPAGRSQRQDRSRHRHDQRRGGVRARAARPGARGGGGHLPAEWFGVSQLTELLDSKVEYVRTSTLRAGRALPRPSTSSCLGVLHLRHPLLALDNLRAVTGGQAVLETAVCAASCVAGTATAHWCAIRGGSSRTIPATVLPSTMALGVVGSSGFEVERVGAWPPKAPARAMLRLAPVEARRHRADLVRAAAALLRQRPHRLAASERRVQQRGGPNSPSASIRSR